MESKRISLAAEKLAIFTTPACQAWSHGYDDEVIRFQIPQGKFFDLVEMEKELFIEFDEKKYEVSAREIVAKILDRQISRVVFYNGFDFLGCH